MPYLLLVYSSSRKTLERVLNYLWLPPPVFLFIRSPGDLLLSAFPLLLSDFEDLRDFPGLSCFPPLLSPVLTDLRGFPWPSCFPPLLFPAPAVLRDFPEPSLLPFFRAAAFAADCLTSIPLSMAGLSAVSSRIPRTKPAAVNAIVTVMEIKGLFQTYAGKIYIAG